ncbi:hypothetical protein GOEFS_036_00210 [Gordonia effusa NBRC 100432]|uniref:Lipoprotein n=1 Tax=Gordonia effusa NBRC 100432 TaxID=1077974 RepID=H0QXN1_9ACTN|nr:hypothetical protein [Gordonia effusa]GAB17582.1 hypothetical protein GOEFS_036_00210 [Gordonia effusa NBRC 100432]
MRKLTACLLAALSCLLLLSGCGGDDTKSSDGLDVVALPSDFPADQIPLLDGRVLTANGTRADGWSITVQGKSDVGNALDAAVKKLTESGFTESSRTTEGGQHVVMLSRKDGDTTYWAQVGATPQAAGGPNSVFYQVNAE